MSKSNQLTGSGFRYPRMALTCSILAIAIATSTTAVAQDAAAPAAADEPQAQAGTSDRLEEIVVTARKRTEKLDTVPLAITAMTSAKIESRNLKSLEDVAAYSPGFYTEQTTAAGFGRNDRTFRQLSFRGVGATSSNLGLRAGGIAFVDGSPVLGSSLANVQDLERVEVLRGPQAAYFGRSTFIGAVNYITKDPSSTWTGRITAEYAGDNQIDLSGAISGPLADWASIRVSGRYFSKDGQYKTANEFRRLGDQSTKSVSVTLLLKPIDNLRIRTTLNHFVDDDGPSAQYLYGGRNYNPTLANPNPTPVLGGSNCKLGGTVGGLQGGSGGSYYCGRIPQTLDPRLLSANLGLTPFLIDGLVNNSTNIPQNFSVSGFIDDYGLKRSALQFSNRIDYSFDDGAGPTLTLVTAYHEEKLATLSDFNGRGGIDPVTGATIFQISTLFASKSDDFSQEVRLVSAQSSRFRWVVGANYLKLNAPTAYVIGQGPSFLPANFFAPSLPYTIANFGAAQPGFDKAETPSVFGGLYFDIIPKRLTISAEGRYQADKVSSLYYSSNAAAYGSISKTFKSFSPRVSVDYKLTPDSTVYALYSRGTKPGGFNTTSVLTPTTFQLNQLLLALPVASAAFDEETLDNYEAGIKGSFLDGRLRMALDGYIGRYKGAQVPVAVSVQRIPTGPGPLVLSPTLNIGNINLKGVEFEAEALLFPGFRLGATFAYTDTKIKQYFCSECSAIFPQTASAVPLGAPAGSPAVPIPQGASVLPGSVNYTGAIGKKLPGAPTITYSLSASYERKLNSDVTGYVGADYLYRGKYYADAANVANSGNSQIVNVRIGARKGPYSLEVFARNLLNDQSPGVGYSSLGTNFGGGNFLRIALPDQRRIGVRVAAGF